MDVSENITQSSGSDAGSDLSVEVNSQTIDVSLEPVTGETSAGVNSAGETTAGVADPDGAGTVNQEITIDFPEFTDLSEYNEFNPFPVYVVEEILPEAVGFALSDTYPGTISDTYLDYFEGIVQKLGYDTHYVIWRSGSYSYTLAYGSGIELNGSTFTGDCNTVQIYRESESYNSTWYVAQGSDTLSLNADSLFVYSDLGMYSTVERGFGVLESNTILFSVGLAFVVFILHDFFAGVQRLFKR